VKRIFFFVFLALLCLGLGLLLSCSSSGGGASRGGDDAFGDDDYVSGDDDTSDDDAANDDDASDDDASDDDASDDDASDDDDDAADDDSGDEVAPKPSDDIGVFVAKTGNDDNPGTMSQPKLTINAGLDLARDKGKDLFVAEGTYNETITEMNSAVSFYGGYEPTHWNRNIESFKTIVDSDSPNGVLWILDFTASVAIEGFTIQSSCSGSRGIWIYSGVGPAVVNKNKVIMDGVLNEGIDIGLVDGLIIVSNNNVTLTGNSSGPGISGFTASCSNEVTIKDNVVNIASNGAGSTASGIEAGNSSVVITNNKITNHGGSTGLYTKDALAVHISDNEIESGEGNNESFGLLGFNSNNATAEYQIKNNRIKSGSLSGDDAYSIGLYFLSDAGVPFSGVVEQNFISSGTVSGNGSRAVGIQIANLTGGAGISNDKTSLAFVNNVIQAGNGGWGSEGFFLDDLLSEIVIIDNDISTGTADWHSFGVGTFISTQKIPKLVNNSITLGKVTDGPATGIYCEYLQDAAVNVIHNDIWSSSSFCFVNNLSNICIDELTVFNECQWDGCASADSNISANPLYVDSGAGDYHLSGGSPCIDAGIKPTPWYTGDSIYVDFEGDTRPQGVTWDIGADEYKAK